MSATIPDDAVVAQVGDLRRLTDGRLGHDYEEERFVYVLRRDPCAYCGKSGGTVDHIVPRHGQRHTDRPLSNLTGACGYCNQRKGHFSLLGYLLQRREAPTWPAGWKVRAA